MALVMVGLMTVHAVNPFTNDSITRADMDPVVVSLDSMSYQLFTRDKLFGNTAELQQSIALTRDQLPTYAPAEMKRRMQMIPSLISMDYNGEVQAFIDLFVYRRRDLLTKLLASSQIYFPMMEEILDRNHMPDELKYLPVIESALNPQAVSPAGATGLWQMMYGTGKLMGLEGNSIYDERRDPVKATMAGVKYLKQLYDMYGDWLLALAAYNSGPGYVNKAIARSGGVKNFWAIKNMLPLETRSYVPTFIAMVYAMHYHNDYKIVSAEPKRELYAVDTVMIRGRVTLKHIAQVLGMAPEELQFLNPCLKAGIVPTLPNGYPVNIPVNYFATFESRKDAILYDPELTAQATLNESYANPTMVRVPRYIWYKVRRGDNLGAIAARYGVGLAELREWNGLKKNYIYAGQNLKILTFPEVPVYGQPATANSVAPQAAVTACRPAVVGDSAIITSCTPQSGANVSIPDSAQVAAEKVLFYYEKGAAANGGDVVLANPSAPASKPSSSPISAASVKYYRVQSGDSLWSITQHYPGLSIDKLKSDNNLSGQSIVQGQVLKIVM
jgi:membrane-bound lytic murein transglycosylase D